MAATVSVEGADSQMELFEASPSGDARGAVVVIQEAFGITDHIEDVCRRFAAEGYYAVAPHLFHRTGDPIIEYDDIEGVMPHVMRLNAGDLEADLKATIEHVTGAGFAPGQIAVVGFCMGGTIALFAAASYGLGAAVTFYGGGIAQSRFGLAPLVDQVRDLQTPWLGMYGDQDLSIPVDEVEWLRTATESAPKPAEVVRYPDANHGFHCDARDSYHEESAKDGWQRTLRWLDAHLASP
jgi:carboxymethylenebutenolidase